MNPNIGTKYLRITPKYLHRYAIKLCVFFKSLNYLPISNPQPNIDAYTKPAKKGLQLS